MISSAENDEPVDAVFMAISEGKTMNIKYTVRCSRCGDDSIDIPDHPDDGTIVTCGECDIELCTIYELNARTRDISIDAVAEHLRNVLDHCPSKKLPVIELEL